jgi:NAD(P)-dependent dehydrogenase (short-subunit alcohol dehydrogenase family)
VLVHGRDAERGARIVAEIEASGGTASIIAADLPSLDEVHRLAGTVQATVGRLDILINNAGIGTGGPRQTSAEGSELRFAVKRALVPRRRRFEAIEMHRETPDILASPPRKEAEHAIASTTLPTGCIASLNAHCIRPYQATRPFMAM